MMNSFVSDETNTESNTQLLIQIIKKSFGFDGPLSATNRKLIESFLSTNYSDDSVETKSFVNSTETIYGNVSGSSGGKTTTGKVASISTGLLVQLLTNGEISVQIIDSNLLNSSSAKSISYQSKLSLIFFKYISPNSTTNSKQGTANENGLSSETQTIIRWVTDDEAIVYLSKILTTCSDSNREILDSYHQLLRFADREKVLQQLSEERSIFIQKVSDWSENLLEVEEENGKNDEEEEEENDTENKVGEIDKQLETIGKELGKLTQKILKFKRNEKFLIEILSNYVTLFRDVANQNQYRQNLLETANMLNDEAGLLFDRWSSEVSNNMRYDLTRQCIVFDPETQLPQITFSKHLENFASHAGKLREFDYKIPPDISKIELHVSRYVSIVRELRDIVRFYCTVAEQILVCQRPMLIEQAKAFTGRLESKGQKLTWNDDVTTITAWIDELKKFMNVFIEENQQLHQLHRQVLELIKQIIDVPFSNWQSPIDKVQQIMDGVDQQYRNTLTWHKHWDYQLYKILNYYFNYLMTENDRNSRPKVSSNEGISSMMVGRNMSQYGQSELTISQQQQRLLFFDSSNNQNQNQDNQQSSPRNKTTIELQFNPAGFVAYEPPLEELKRSIFGQLQRFIAFPSLVHSFVDSYNHRNQAGGGKTVSLAGSGLYRNVYHRNADKFANVYQKAIDAIEELVNIRDQFNEWCSLYHLIKAIKLDSLYSGRQNFDDDDSGSSGSNFQFTCRTLNEYQHNLQLIKELSLNFSQTFMLNELHCQASNYTINLIPIKMFIEWLLDELQNVLLKMFRDQCEQEIVHIESVCRDTVELIQKQPETIDELIVIDKFFKDDFESIRSNLLVSSVTLKEKIHFLKSWQRPGSNMVNLPNLTQTSTRLKEFERLYDTGSDVLVGYRELLQNKVSESLDANLIEVDNFIARWMELDEQLKQSPEVISDFQINCSQLMDKVDELEKTFDYFAIGRPKSFDTILEISDEIRELYGKFNVLYEFDQGLSHYLEMEWIVCRNKLAKINQYIVDWLEQNGPGGKSTGNMDDGMLRAHVADWQKLLAVLELCRGDFYQQLHWNKFLSTILNLSDKNYEDLKLSDLANRRTILVEKRAAILELNKRAFNDYSLREALNELDQFAINGKFVLYQYQTKQSKEVMLIKDWTESFHQISDCFLLIQTVKNIENSNQENGTDSDNQSVSDEYLQAYHDWENKLVRLESLMTLLNSVQRKWISLEPIYSSNSFFNDSMFSRFSVDFQDLMSKVIDPNEPRFVRLLSSANLEGRLKAIDNNFSLTQKKLHAFIEESRQRFPRFYFLADEDLLLILSGKVDLNQSALVKKLFVNTVGRLIYRSSTGDAANSSDTSIESIESIQGEIIRLRRSIRTDNSAGPIGIENWLKELDEEIKSTLKYMFNESLPQIGRIVSSAELIAVLPSQLLTLLGWIDFTEKVEESIRRRTLGELKSEYDTTLARLTRIDFLQQLLECSQRQQTASGSRSSVSSSSRRSARSSKVRSSNRGDNYHVLEYLCKMKIKQTVLDVIHFITVIESLIDNKVTACNSWCWQSQLRFYVKSKPAKPESNNNVEIEVQMGLACFDYSFDYLGCLGDSKLVHTELTNKCFLTLTQAMDLGLGGNPYGPAGTGKTESVKALGHYLGRQVLVFNCDEAIDVKSMTRILIGLIKCGSWGCFDEFNRLQLDVLSILSSQIQEIQNSIKNKSTCANLSEYGNVSINNNAAIFITLNPAGKDYGGRNRIPDNLKSLFLPVAMTIPDSKIIARFLLLAEGFSDSSAKILGDKLTMWFELSQGSMSQQKHYDYGLRAIKACLEASGRRLQAQRVMDGNSVEELESFEIRLVLDTLRQQIKSKLVDDDATKFDGLVEAVFGKGSIRSEKLENENTAEDNNLSMSKLDSSIRKVIKESNLVESEYQLAKIDQLYEQLQTRFGIVLIGPSGSGKTTIWQTLRKAIEKQGQIEANAASTTMINDDGSEKCPQFVNVTVINPKALERSKLFGFIDEDTREWHDGLFSVKSREIARDDSPNAMNWIVFDGDIDPDWVEALNSVLDDNRVLTLPSGERIDFDLNRCRILFETSSLRFASPATISRLGVVCIDQIMSDEVIHSYLAQKQLTLSSQVLVDEFVRAQPTSTLMSSVKSMLEHLNHCSQNHENEQKAFDRLQGRSTGPADSMINNLVVTESLAPCVQFLIPSIVNNYHLCLVGPVGSGKSTLATEIIFTANGHLLTVDCTPSSTASTLTKALFSACTIVPNGTSKSLRPLAAVGRIWIFVRHFELISYDKWHSNSLVSLLLLLLKYSGFPHPETFEWITLDKFQIVITCTEMKLLDDRLLSSMHIVQMKKPNLAEIDQILTTMTKSVDSNILTWFPGRYLQLVDQLIKQSSTEELSPMSSNHQLNYLKIGIDILDSLNHYDSGMVGESVVDYEIYRTVRSCCCSNREEASILEQNLYPGNSSNRKSIYTSTNGLAKFSEIEIEQFEQQIMKWMRIYCAEMELETLSDNYELLPQVTELVADLCSFMATGNDSRGGQSQEMGQPGNVQTMLIVGNRGSGRKYFSKMIAHIFGYDRVWSPSSISSDRHLVNELRALLNLDDQNSGDEHQSSSSKTKLSTTVAASSNANSSQKILLLIDQIHFEILPYLRDRIFIQLKNQQQSGSSNYSNATTTTTTVRLIITVDRLSELDHLMWLRQASLHRVFQLEQESYRKLTERLVSPTIESNHFEPLKPEVLDQFYQIYSHFCRRTTITPKQLANVRFYVGFVRTFLELFESKLEKIGHESDHLRLGVAKLDQVYGQVNLLKDDALKQKELLDAKRAEADEAFNLIMNSMHESEDKKVELEDIQKRIEIETVNLKERKVKIDQELEQIEPVLQSVKAAVGGISSNALTEIRSLRAPPEVIRDILEGVLRLMGVNDTSWISMKTFLSRRGVKEEIMNFDCHKITPQICAKVEQLLKSRSDSFQPAVAKRASAAAALLAEWVKANVEYSRVLHKIGPLEAELAKLENGLVRAQSRMKTLNMQLEGVDTEVDTLRARMQAVTVEAAQIEINLKKSTDVLQRSEDLVGDLNSEHVRWNSKLQQIETERSQQIDRCIVTAAYITCASCESSFTKRAEMLKQCFDKFQIDPFDLTNFYAVDSEEEQLFLFGSSANWLQPIPLICDPAHKALQFFDNYEMTRLSSADWLKVLELSIRFGRTLVVTDFNSIDIRLVPLIFGNVNGSSKSRYWTFLGDRKVDYNPKFRLYVLTENVQNVSPTSLSLFRVINLSPSFSGISAQLLAQIINAKRPELEEEKEKVESGLRKLRRQLNDLETELLEKLSTESGNILENVELIEKLRFLKKSLLQIEKSLQESGQLRLDLENERQQYQDISQFAANIFFCIGTLSKLCSMYYFGYVEFELIFKQTLHGNLNNDTLCYTFFNYVARALFAEHRLALRHYFWSQFPSESSRILNGANSLNEMQGIGEFIYEVGIKKVGRTRLALVLTSPGSDPTTEIQNTVVNQLGYQLRVISMGNDVVELASSLLRSKQNEPNFALCLSNLHLVVGWLPELSQLLNPETMSSAEPRLVILVTEVCDNFPIALLEICTKFAYESVPGLKAHIRRLEAGQGNKPSTPQQQTYANLNTDRFTGQKNSRLAVNSSRMVRDIDSDDQRLFANLLNLLQYFHAICCERRFYLPFGWTKNYEFGFNEFRFAENIIKKVLLLNAGSEGDKSQANDRLGQLFDYIFGLFKDVIYGGKVDFVVDELVLKLLLKRCFDLTDFAGKQQTSRIGGGGGGQKRNKKFTMDGMDEADIDDPNEGNEFSMLGLPLNAESFRNRIIDEKLKQNLQLLTANATIINGGGDEIGTAAPEISDQMTETTGNKKPVQRPSGLIYFQKLWLKILTKCKLDRMGDFLEEKLQSRKLQPPSEPNHSNWNEFVRSFVNTELIHSKRLMAQIDSDLMYSVNNQDSNNNNGDESNKVGDLENVLHRLKLNQTLESWQKMWPDGPEMAQDFLFILTKIYIKLFNFDRVSQRQRNSSDSSGSVVFDLTSCFHPKQFLNLMKQFASNRLSVCIDQLTMKYCWTSDSEPGPTAESTAWVASLSGISLEGAIFSQDRLQLCVIDSPFSNPMPPVNIWITVQNQSHSQPKYQSSLSSVSLPLYTSTKRETILEHFDIPCQSGTESKWIEMGVALVLGNFNQN